jgi:2-polyprenyl-3-methyl-5-hydroxy-6-metoxy-1,4-benzoquinol methylase
MNVDAGTYNRDQAKYSELAQARYNRYPEGVTLPPEYAYFVQENQLRLFIRLARYKFVARLIKRTDRLLEVGSGSGVGAMFLSQHCAHVTGIEVKTTEVEEARAVNRRPNVEFHVTDLFTMNARHNYDVAVALDVIEHMPIEDGHKLVAAMARQLKPTGMLVVGTPSIYSYDYQSPESRASHVKCYDQQELVELMERHCGRTLAFSMNDELVHTGHPKMAWYYFVLGFLPAGAPVSNGNGR